MKFKVGDKVVVTNDHYFAKKLFHKVGTITSVNKTGFSMIFSDGETQIYLEQWGKVIELAEVFNSPLYQALL